MNLKGNFRRYYKNIFGDTKKEETKSVSYLGLFKYAELKDKLYALFGNIAAAGNGILMPIFLALYGNATDAFVQTQFCFLLDYNISAFCPPDVNEGNINNQIHKCNLSLLNITLPENNLITDVRTQCINMTILGFATWVLSWMQVAFLTLSAENQTLRLRKKLFYSILHKDIQWFDIHSAGSVNSYLVENANKYKNGVGDKIGLIFQAMVTAIACIILGFVKGWKLSLVILACSPILIAASFLMTKVSTRSTNIETKAYAKAGSVAQEALSNIRTVQSFNGIDKMKEKYETLLDEAKREGIKKGFSNGLAMAVLWIVIFFIYGLGLWYGGKLNHDENLSVGIVLVVFFSVQTAVFSLGSTAPHYHSVVEAKAATHDLYDIIDERPHIETFECYPISRNLNEVSNPELLENNISTIEFKNIKFAYPSRPEIAVLNNFSLKITQGQTVALVGESGSGKSTVVQLLMRFYDPLEGCIVFNGRDIKTLAPNILRKNIGLVSQEPVLFSTTIAENIRLGNENITDDQIENACRTANAHEFIKKLPDKYETFVGESGAQLSGGQKQRIAIARALIHDPKILLLDEATSALDSENEKYVQEALEIASKGRTTIVIAHRLSTVRNADVIVSMDKGAAVEYGTHEELMEKRGLYFKLFDIQTKDHDHDKGAELSYYMKSKRTYTQKSYAEDTYNITDNENEEEPGMSSLLYVMKKNSPEIVLILIGCLCCVIWGVVQTLFNLYFAKFISVFSHCSTDRRQSLINTYCLIFVIFGIILFLSETVKGYAFALSGERLTKRLRLQLFSAILRQDIAYFDKDENSVGTLCTMLSTEASAVQGATGIRIGVMLSNFCILGVGIILSFVLSWELCLVILAFIPLLILAGILSTKLMAGFTAKNKSLLEKAGKVVIEASTNIRTVKQLVKEDYFFKKYSDVVTEAYLKTKNKCLITGFLFGLSQGIIFFAFSAAYYAGAEFLTKGRMSTEEMMFVFGCLIFGAMAVGQNQAMAPDYGKARAAAIKLHKTIEMQPLIDSLSTDGLTTSDVKGEIAFKNVKFEYPSRAGITVLRDINLNIAAGSNVAFVGSSGCGKSTAIQLMQRFYDPVFGNLELDGGDIKKMNIQWYRKQLSVVGQEPALFNWSIADNVAFGDTSREVSMDEIKAACKTSNIDNFIESLPEGYDTLVGAKGTLISGGQKQRIAIARALVRNPKILLLDEATSALDTESEVAVQEALDRAQKGRTCVSIAHRLSTIKNCNQIFVFKDGIIVERGTHDELTERKGVYYDLYALSAR